MNRTEPLQLNLET